jgi:hypothetical protein
MRASSWNHWSHEVVIWLEGATYDDGGGRVCERCLRKGGTDAIHELHAKQLEAYVTFWSSPIGYLDSL